MDKPGRFGQDPDAIRTDTPGEGNGSLPGAWDSLEQREILRTRRAARIRAEKPLFIADFWNDAPWVGGCIAGGSKYVHPAP